MSYNGSGTFQINTSGQPVVTGTVISSSAFNALTADLATGLSTAITKDGQTATTVRIPFAQGINSSLATDSTSTSTGSIITAGGVGIAKALFVGTTANIAGVTTVQAGTAAAPAITTTGDTNTGIFFPAADTIAFAEGGAEAMRIDSSGNVGIGTTSPSGKLAVTGGRSFFASASETFAVGVKYVSTGGSFYFGASDGSATPDGVFSQAGGTERMRITDAGTLLVGTTSTGYSATNAVALRASSGDIIVSHANGTATGAQYIQFAYNSGQIGGITQNGTTGVLYNLTSDHRLKNNQQALTGAKNFVMSLQPKKWQWWDGSGEGVGFIAHEFMEVAKYSGSGIKDGVDENGKPVMQAIQPSSSEVMANLVSFIQEQQALITSLTDRIVALEAK